MLPRCADWRPGRFPLSFELCPFIHGEWAARPERSVCDSAARAPEKSRGEDTGGHARPAPPAHLSWACCPRPRPALSSAPVAPPHSRRALVGGGGALC